MGIDHMLEIIGNNHLFYKNWVEFGFFLLKLSVYVLIKILDTKKNLRLRLGPKCIYYLFFLLYPSPDVALIMIIVVIFDNLCFVLSYWEERQIESDESESNTSQSEDESKSCLYTGSRRFETQSHIQWIEQPHELRKAMLVSGCRSCRLGFDDGGQIVSFALTWHSLGNSELGMICQCEILITRHFDYTG